jgi:hypothetical protein
MKTIYTSECSRYPGVPSQLCSVRNGVLWRGTRGPSPITRNRFWRVSNTCTTRKLFIETSKVFYLLVVNRCTNGKFIQNVVWLCKKNLIHWWNFLGKSASGICCAKYAQCNMFFCITLVFVLDSFFLLNGHFKMFLPYNKCLPTTNNCLVLLQNGNCGLN